MASIVVAAVAGGLVRIFTDDADIRRNLRSIGVPTTWDQVSGVAIVGVIAALAAMLVGAILGGVLGDRWHAKLERRAADPAYGPDTETGREVAGRRDADYDDRRDLDDRRDIDARRDADYDDRRDLDDRRDVDARRDAITTTVGTSMTAAMSTLAVTPITTTVGTSMTAARTTSAVSRWVRPRPGPTRTTPR